MSYSKSKRAIRRVEPYLTQMVSAEGQIEFPADDASKFAYSIREGIKASREFAVADGRPVEPYASYQALGAKFVIRVKGGNVVCEPRDVVPLARLRDSLSQISIPDVRDTLGIIGAVITHNAPMMVFPDANDMTIDEQRLRVWADNKGYQVIVSDNHVTLTRKVQDA